MFEYFLYIVLCIICKSVGFFFGVLCSEFYLVLYIIFLIINFNKMEYDFCIIILINWNIYEFFFEKNE